MARHEEAREDLMAQATALVERVELRAPPAAASPVVVGFRREGSASVYFGEDPAYHFNSQGELRRAFVAGRLYKAERRRLCSLRRERSDAATELVRHDLNAAEEAQFLAECRQRLATLLTALDAGAPATRASGDVAQLRAQVHSWLTARVGGEIRVANSPRAA